MTTDTTQWGDVAPESGLGPSLGELTARLGEARRKLIMDRLLQAAGFALASALAVFSALFLWDILRGTKVDVSAYLLPAAGAGAGVFLIASVLVVTSAWSQERLARSADRRFGTQERISTALEVAGRGQNDPMSRALIADAAARAGVVQPRLLVPAHWPRAAAVAGLLALLAAGLVMLPRYAEVIAVLPAAEVGAENAVLDVAVLSEMAAEIARISAAIDADADRRDDPYLEAVARELQTLSEAVAAGDFARRDELRAQLERMLGFAADGYARAGASAGSEGDFSRMISDAMASLDAGLDAARGETRTDAAGAEAGAPGSGDQREASGAASDQADQDATAAAGAAQDATSAGSASTAQRALPSGEPLPESDCVLDGDLECYLINPPTEAASVQSSAQNTTAPPNPSQGSPEAGFVIGPSQQAGRGDSTLAGSGVDRIGGGRTWSPEEFAVTDEVVLEDQRVAGEGNRIRLDIAPEIGRPALAEGSRAGEGEWRPQAERDVGRTLLPPEWRDVVARYFQTEATE